MLSDSASHARAVPPGCRPTSPRAASPRSTAAADADALEEARIQFLGDRRGELLALQKALGTLPPEQRRDAGRAFNDAKTALTHALDERRAALQPRRGDAARSST